MSITDQTTLESIKELLLEKDINTRILFSQFIICTYSRSNNIHIFIFRIKDESIIVDIVESNNEKSNLSYENINFSLCDPNLIDNLVKYIESYEPTYQTAYVSK